MKNKANPWKGLNFYVEGEIIFGRDFEILNLSHYIFNNTQTVLYGRSGIGKSSIINAGIFPEARHQNMVPVTVRLKHDGDDSYLEQIKKALVNEGVKFKPRREVIDPAKESLWEFLHRQDFISASGEPIVPLIVFDQFEEIFTLQTSEHIRKNFFNELADLFNNIKPTYVVDYEKNKADEKQATQKQTIDTDSFKGLTLNLNLNLKKPNSAPKEKGYVESPNYHMVFALREDFLSSLEIYAHNIPVMKNNRFALLPINEEQAAEIIMRPCPGVIDKDVAKLIIEKVTGRTDFKLDGNPQIEVDSAILSLYLSRLYDKMTDSGEDRISVELVESYSANIIDDFYSDAIAGLSAESVQWIEDTLVNAEGRRDNRDRSTVLKEGHLTVDELNRLINDTKILRQFSYDGYLRVELIHDVLCPVIIKHRKEREERLKLKQLEAKTKKEKLILFIRTVAIAAIVVLAIICGAIWYIDKSQDLNIVGKQQNLVISFAEDESVSDLDFWKARLIVTGRVPSGADSVICDTTINKTEISKPITINATSCSRLDFLLDFGDFVDIGSYENVEKTLSANDLTKSPYITLDVKRNKPNFVRFEGRLVLDVDKLQIPLENTIVMIGDAVGKSDSTGNFTLLLEDAPDNKTSLLIAKGGLGCYELPALNGKGELKGNLYSIFPTDSLKGFNEKVAEMEAADRWNYSTVGAAYCANQGSANGLYVKFNDGHDDRLKMYWKKGVSSGGRTSLTGYFYFKKENDNLKSKHPENGKFAYYIGSGYIDSKIRRDENNAAYRNFEFKGYDAASNVRTVTGKYYTVKGAGKYTGDITSNKRRIASFGHKQ